MLTMLYFMAFALPFALAQNCLNYSPFTEVCQTRSGLWKGTTHQLIRKFSHPEYKTTIGIINFNPTHGSPAPLIKEQCVYPCYHDYTQTPGALYWTGESEDSILGSFSAKFGGLISTRMFGETFDNIGVCESSSCPTPQIRNGGYILDLEWMTTAHANRGNFISSASDLYQLGPVMCYGSTRSDLLLWSGERKCTHFLWNGYDGSGYNQLVTIMNSGDLDSYWYINHTLAIPLYGWDYPAGQTTGRKDQCVKGFDGDRSSFTLGQGTGKVTYMKGLVSTDCVFNTARQIKDFYKNQLAHTKVTSFVGWSNYPRNEMDNTGVFDKMSRFRSLVKDWYPMFLGFNANYTSTLETTSFFNGDCRWIKEAIVPPGTVCTPFLRTNNRPFYTCSLSCSGNITFKSVSNLIPFIPNFVQPPDVLSCSPSFNGIFLSYSTPYALLDNKHQCVSSGPTTTFCEHTSCDFSLICSVSSCFPVSIKQTPITAPLQYGRLERGEFYPPGHSRVARRLTSYMSLAAEGSSMTLCHYSVSGPRTCMISDGEVQHSHSCNEKECCKTLSPYLFASGSEVTYTCGHDNDKGVWDPWGSGTGSTILGWVVGNFAVQPWWIKCSVILVLIWALKTALSILQYDSIVGFARTVAWFILNLTWNFPQVVWLSIKSFLWGFRSKKQCSGCCAFPTLVSHSSAGCPYTDGSFCPFCECKTDKVCTPPTMKHYIFVHMWQHVNSVFYMCPWNYVAKTWLLERLDAQTPTEIAITNGISTHTKKRGKKSLLSFTPIVVLGLLLTPVHGLSDVLATETCNSNFCMTTSTIQQEGLWPGDSSCFQVKSTSSAFSFCLNLGPASFQALLPVSFCRAEATIVQHTSITCASEQGCANAPDIFSNYPNCTKIWDEERKFDGYTDWGCGLPNVNSACIRAVLLDTGHSTHCVVSSPEITKVISPLCATFDGNQICSSTGKITFKNVTFDYSLETDTTVVFPPKMVVDPEGQLHTYREDNGCFGFRRERYYSGSPACNSGILRPTGCRWVIRHWYDSSVVCSSQDPSLCTSELSYPRYNPNCNVSTASPSSDGLSFQVSGIGCDHTLYKLTGVLKANVSKELKPSSVTSLKVDSCGGLSSTPNGASCRVTPYCSGVGSCKLSSPVNQDLPCNHETVVFFFSSGNVSFVCSGIETSVHVDLRLPSSDKFVIPRPLPGINLPDVSSIPWWGWLILVISLLFLISFIIMIFVLCSHRKTE
ncbi:glycoprotein precursor [Turtle fraservirus 1]|uniref:glycoprotein precursor n=1 Tax=Turtle fraservirus 1 TaxID=2912878 RepID=UPI002483B36A|nr:glycoprotein precursor [Turtle fraservirus 1]UJT32110.1 glycoprotein precursor [Turtle fraservirus 1]